MAFPSWAIGVLLSICASVSDSLAMNFQKLSHRDGLRRYRAYSAESNGSEGKKSNKKPHLFVRCYALHPLWILGLVLFLVGGGFSVGAYYFASVTQLAPMGSVTTAVNMVISPVLFGEKMTFQAAIWTFLVVAGTTAALIFGPKDDGVYGLDELVSRFEKTPFLIYGGVLISALGCIVGVIFVATLIVKSKRRKQVNSGQASKLPQGILLLYPAMGGIFGSITILCLKAVMCGDPIGVKLCRWEIYALALGAVFCLLMQMRFLNYGLMSADSVFVVPMYQAFWVLGSVVNGMVYFQDYRTMSTSKIVCFCFANMFTLFCVFALSYSKEKPCPVKGWGSRGSMGCQGGRQLSVMEQESGGFSGNQGSDEIVIVEFVSDAAVECSCPDCQDNGKPQTVPNPAFGDRVGGVSSMTTLAAPLLNT